MRYLFLTFLSDGKLQVKSWRWESQREGKRMNNETVINPKGSWVSISYSTLPPILSLTLPICINIEEHCLLSCGTWTRAGLWRARRSAGKWLQRRVRSVAHSPWTWAQGFQVGRNPTLQPLSVHPSPAAALKKTGYCKGGKYRAMFYIILSVIQKWTDSLMEFWRYSWSTAAITKRKMKAVFNLGICLLLPAYKNSPQLLVLGHLWVNHVHETIREKLNKQEYISSWSWSHMQGDCYLFLLILSMWSQPCCRRCCTNPTT